MYVDSWGTNKIPSLNVCLFVKLGVWLSKKVAHESFYKDAYL